MDYRELTADDMDRIGEVDRTETIHVEYRVEMDDTGFGLVARRVELAEPWSASAWSADGVRERAGKWKTEIERGGRFYGAFSEERLVGFVVIGPRLQAGAGEICALFVDQHHRRSGMGHELMAWAEVEARAAGIRVLFLASNPTGSAVDFYRCEGFQIVGLVSKQLFKGLSGDIKMVKVLEEA